MVVLFIGCRRWLLPIEDTGTVVELVAGGRTVRSIEEGEEDLGMNEMKHKINAAYLGRLKVCRVGHTVSADRFAQQTPDRVKVPTILIQ